MTQAAYDALLAYAECEEARYQCNLPDGNDSYIGTFRRHGWVPGTVSPAGFLIDLRRKALTLAREAVTG
jgi:hypothetical protein